MDISGAFLEYGDKNPNHKQQEKVCAKEVLTKNDLQRNLRERMPDREINIISKENKTSKEKKDKKNLTDIFLLEKIIVKKTHRRQRNTKENVINQG